MGKDYYRILGVDKTANSEDLKRAYRKLAIKWHPDKHNDSNKAKAEEMFKDIAEAYDVLSDSEKKKIYDTFGEEGLKGGMPSSANMSGSSGGHNVRFVYGGVDPSEVFSSFFGRHSPFQTFDDDLGTSGFFMSGGGGGSAFENLGSMSDGMSLGQRRPKPKAFSVDLKLSLEELYSGTHKRMKVTRKRFRNQTCFQEEKILDVTVKPGWKDGTKITFSGEGDQEGPSQPLSDMVFIVKTRPHNRFVRNGNHLLYTVKITLGEALTGKKISIETLDGRQIPVNVLPCTNPKSRRIISNEGLPSSKTGEKGDLIIDFEIQFPVFLPPERAEQIARLLKST